MSNEASQNLQMLMVKSPVKWRQNPKMEMKQVALDNMGTLTLKLCHQTSLV